MAKNQTFLKPILKVISESDLRLKRVFDLLFSAVLLVLFLTPMVCLWLLASLDAKAPGLFVQTRVGQHGRLFRIYKLRSMRQAVRADSDASVSGFGRFLRSTHLDELPQLYNILIGDMSFVGPRPDVPGFADCLEGRDRIILKVKPGLTGPATLRFAQEEILLKQQLEPDQYNRDVIWIEKVEINKAYVENWSFIVDLRILVKTILQMVD